MATRDIYERTFDEDDYSSDASATPCPECDGQVLNDGQETSCIDCGLVLGEYRIDHGPEWAPAGDGEDSHARTGAPRTPAQHDHGLSTTIGRYRDGQGRTLSGRTQRHLRRLRQHHSWAQCSTTRARNLRHGLAEIRRLVATLDLPRTIRDQACVLFRTAQRESLLTGRSVESMAAASVYGICRCNGLLRTPSEVSLASSVDAVTILKRYAVLNTELGLQAMPPRPRDYLSKFATALDASKVIRTRATELVIALEAVGSHVGYNPRGVAGACLYLAMSEADLLVTQQTVAEVAGVSTATLRKRCDDARSVEV